MSLGRLKSVFVNKADPDQVALVRAARSGSVLSAYEVKI